MSTHQLDERHVATILEALRQYQRTGQPGDIASDDGRLEPLDDNEVDDLCEALNC